MRENLGVYRGKTKDGEWVEGFLCFHYVDGKNENGVVYTGKSKIYDQENVKSCDVITETVGEWTGKRDCKRTTEYPEGQRIFDNDVVHCWGGEYFNGIYEFNQTFVVKDAYDIVTLCEFEYVEVIGNIHDNPELVKE